MTPEPNLPLRARVALLLGWRREYFYGSSYWYDPEGIFRGTNIVLPPYDTSRDAAMEAVHALLVTREHWRAFLEHLEAVTGARQQDDWVECIKRAVTATPAEICEALLAALGKGVAG